MTIRPYTQTTIIAGTAGLLLLAGAALGQTTPPQKQPMTPPTTQNQPAATQPTTIPPVGAPVTQLKAAPDPLRMEDVSRIKGAPVWGTDNRKLGSVATMLMEPASKTIDRLVISDGGILGVGSHLVAIPIADFSWDPQTAVFRLAISSDELKRLPEWKEQLTQLPPGDMPASATPVRPMGAAKPAPAPQQ